MRYAIVNILLFALVLAFSAGCSKKDGREEVQPAHSKTGVAESSTVRHCFRNEYPFNDGSDQKDIEELVVAVDGDRVTGEYNWIPVYKDSRLGRFDGSIQDGLIHASYEFQQEGQPDTANISITVTDGEAIIKGPSPELGFDATLARVGC